MGRCITFTQMEVTLRLPLQKKNVNPGLAVIWLPFTLYKNMISSCKDLTIVGNDNINVFPKFFFIDIAILDFLICSI